MYILCVCLISLCAVLFNLLICDTEINQSINQIKKKYRHNVGENFDGEANVKLVFIKVTISKSCILNK